MLAQSVFGLIAIGIENNSIRFVRHGNRLAVFTQMPLQKHAHGLSATIVHAQYIKLQDVFWRWHIHDVNWMQMPV